MPDATQFDASAESAGAAFAADLTGKSLGDYQILGQLGQGGMGQVYLADQISLKRKVALKFLKPEFAADPTALQRFRNEAEAVARITHANIVQIYAIGESDGLSYMALEYVDGRNLRELIVRKGPPDLPVCLAIMRQVAAALQRAGESGIVHRDIKPENILITRKVEVKVADFGLRRDAGQDRELNLTKSGMTMGTPLYMSPEQVRGQPVDPRSDIYSFGVTCWHMFAGRPPFGGQNAIEVALKHCEEQPPALADARPDLPPELCALVHRMMHKDPTQRPQTGREVLRELAQFQRGVAAPVAVSMSLPEPDALADTQPFAAAKRRRGWLIGGASLVAALGVGAGVRLLHNVVAGPPIVEDNQPKLEVISNSERMWLLGVEDSANPKPDKVREGLSYRVRLGVLYLDQKRYDEATQFFAEMQKRTGTPQYAALGCLGGAIVLAFGNGPESAASASRMFNELRTRYPAYRGLFMPASLPPEDSINLKFWTLRALDRIAGPSGTLPQPLERLREDVKGKRPPGPAGKL